jgi:hypothetical protein
MQSPIMLSTSSRIDYIESAMWYYYHSSICADFYLYINNSEWNFITTCTCSSTCSMGVLAHSLAPMRIRVRIGPPHPLLSPKRRLNEAVLRRSVWDFSVHQVNKQCKNDNLFTILLLPFFIYLSGGSSCQNLLDSLSDEVPSFTGQIENLPEISGSPASFAISVTT